MQPLSCFDKNSFNKILKTHSLRLLLSAASFLLVMTMLFVQTQSAHAQSLEQSTPPSNNLSISPIQFMVGKLAMNYEHLFGEKHGIDLEGDYGFGNGYDVVASYRYHYGIEDSLHPLNSPFWGFFIHTGRSTTDIEDPDTHDKFKMKTRVLALGINIGRRYAWGDIFSFAWRIGYGYPIVCSIDWSPIKYHDYKTFEGVAKILAGIDGELSVGVSF